MAGTAVGHPFDTLKVRAQATSTSAVQIGLQMLRADGGIGMMRGLSAALSGYVPLDIIMFATYGAALRYLNGRDEKRWRDRESVGARCAPRPLPSLWNYGAAGALAGVVYAPISVPFEVLKIRMQLDVGRGAERMGMVQMALHILRTEGMGALTQGARITLLREGEGVLQNFQNYTVRTVTTFSCESFSHFDSLLGGPGYYYHASSSPPWEVPEHAIWFASFEGFKRALRRADRSDDEMDHFASLFGGGLAGVVAYMAMFPIDTVKTRIQMCAAPRTTSVSFILFTADIFAQSILLI